MVDQPLGALTQRTRSTGSGEFHRQVQPGTAALQRNAVSWRWIRRLQLACGRRWPPQRFAWKNAFMERAVLLFRSCAPN